MQEPDDTGTNGFKISGSNVVFSSAPESGDSFWGVYQGQNVDIGTPSDDVVDTIHIKDNAITAAKIAAGTIVASDIASNSITNVKMADDSVDSDEIVAGAIDTAHIGANQVTAAKVAADVATQAELDTVSTVASAALPKAGGTMTGTIADFTSTGIDDNADATAITIDSSEDITFSKNRANAVSNVTLHNVSSTGFGTGIDFSCGYNGGYDLAKIDTENSSTGGQLRFYTSNTSGTITERMKINHSGNVGIGDTDPSEAKLSIDNVAAGDRGLQIVQAQDEHGLYIDQNGNETAIYIDSEATSKYGILVYGKYPIQCIQDISGGYAGYFYRDLDEAGSFPLVTIKDDHTSNTQDALKIQQDGAGIGLHIDQNGNEKALYIDSESTTYGAAALYGKFAVQGTQDISGGYAAYFERNIAEAGTYPLVSIIDEHASNTQPALKIKQDGAGYGLEIDQNGNQPALYIDSESSANAITVYSKFGIYAGVDISGGYAGYFARNLDEAGSYPLVYIVDDHTSNTQPALKVKQDGTGLCADFVGDKIRVADGILFGTDTADANALDDYEEGTWTPELGRWSSSGAAVSATYTQQTGWYVKVGNIVTVGFYLSTSAIASQGSSIVYIRNKPFTNSGDYNYGFSGAIADWGGFSNPTGAKSFIPHSTYNAILVKDTTSGNHDDDWQAGSVSGSITYMTD
jgi:hypothetical protein